MNQVVILALIAALQKEVVLLENELSAQQVVVSSTVSMVTPPATTSPIFGDVAPTSTESGSPIVYVNDEPQPCGITVTISSSSDSISGVTGSISWVGVAPNTPGTLNASSDVLDYQTSINLDTDGSARSFAWTGPESSTVLTADFGGVVCSTTAIIAQ